MTTAATRRRPANDSALAGILRIRDELDDGRLAQQHLEGDPQAFGALVDRYHTSLVDFINGTIPHAERAEDLVQEIFIRVFRHLRGFDQTKRFSTWIYAIASNLAERELRSRSRCENSPHPKS